MLRGKARQVAAAIGYDPDSYGGRAVIAAIEAHPRDELLQASAAELTPIIAEIADQDDPREVISYFRAGAWGRFLTALLFFPRERYNTTDRTRLAGLMMEATGAESFQWSAQVSESPLARLYFTLKMPAGHQLPELDQPGCGWPSRRPPATGRPFPGDRRADGQFPARRGWSEATKATPHRGDQ